MPRPCSSCNKLASLEVGEPEVNSDVELSNGTLTAEVRVVKTSACCGEEMKEFVFNLETDISGELEDHVREKHSEKNDEESGDGEEAEVEVDDGSFEIDAESPEATERTQDKDRHGKAIKSFRYRKSYTGVSIAVSVKCSLCGDEVWKGTLEDETTNSSFDEI